MRPIILFFSLAFMISCSSEISKDEKIVEELCGCYSELDNEILSESSPAWKGEYYDDAMEIIRLQHVEVFLIPKIKSGIDWMSMHGGEPGNKQRAQKGFRTSLHLLRLLSNDIRNLQEKQYLFEIKPEDRDSSYYERMHDFADLMHKHFSHYRRKLEQNQDKKIQSAIKRMGQKYYFENFSTPKNLTRKQFDYYERVNEILYSYLEETKDFDAKAFQKALKSKCGMRFW